MELCWATTKKLIFEYRFFFSYFVGHLPYFLKELTFDCFYQTRVEFVDNICRVIIFQMNVNIFVFNFIAFLLSINFKIRFTKHSRYFFFTILFVTVSGKTVSYIITFSVLIASRYKPLLIIISQRL